MDNDSKIVDIKTTDTYILLEMYSEIRKEVNTFKIFFKDISGLQYQPDTDIIIIGIKGESCINILYNEELYFLLRNKMWASSSTWESS